MREGKVCHDRYWASGVCEDCAAKAVEKKPVVGESPGFSLIPESMLPKMKTAEKKPTHRCPSCRATAIQSGLNEFKLVSPGGGGHIRCRTVFEPIVEPAVEKKTDAQVAAAMLKTAEAKIANNAAPYRDLSREPYAIGVDLAAGPDREYTWRPGPAVVPQNEPEPERPGEAFIPFRMARRGWCVYNLVDPRGIPDSILALRNTDDLVGHFYNRLVAGGRSWSSESASELVVEMAKREAQRVKQVVGLLNQPMRLLYTGEVKTTEVRPDAPAAALTGLHADFVTIDEAQSLPRGFTPFAPLGGTGWL